MAAWRTIQGWNRGARMRRIIECINQDVEEAAYRGSKRAMQEVLAEGSISPSTAKDAAAASGAPAKPEPQQDRWQSAASDWEEADLTNAPEISDNVLGFLRSLDGP